MDIGNRRESELGLMRRVFSGMVVAAFFALAPSTVPDWRSDPSVRTVAVLPIGEPIRFIDSGGSRRKQSDP
ncbi:MAG: hypothetical protein QNJ77_02805 [Acidimicrobiia bacterium]|nr:hypothetical protein [Acidimicrobiia bacterium]